MNWCCTLGYEPITFWEAQMNQPQLAAANRISS